jgi:hypothetical protein
MTSRLVAASLFLVAATAATASAQAPGEMDPQQPPVQQMPSAAPGETPPCTWAVPHESVMANRWAIGLSVGSLSLAPKDQPDNKTDFGVGELSLRYRATLHLELELAVGGGQQKLQDGTNGDQDVHTGMLAARYRFAPEERWNWWVMGGLGGVSVAPHGAPDQAFKDAQRPMGALGIGIERRFHHFALQAELRGVGVGPQKDNSGTVMATPTAPPAGPNSTTTLPPTTTPPAPMSPNTDHLSGGMLTIGASYYF